MQKPSSGNQRSEATPVPELSIFLTDLGWFGLLGRGKKVAGLTIGHTSPNEVRQAIQQKHVDSSEIDQLAEDDWQPELRIRLIRYAQGETEDFRDVEVDLPRLTEFQSRVIEVTRRIPYGETISYGQLAERANSPRAARAVGSVMAANRFPVLIPCHRVVAGGGRLGGFSAAQGVSLKEQMLVLEGVLPTLGAAPLGKSRRVVGEREPAL